ncbi:J domain-containing protein [uncultured Sphingomonas sp.]|uniref:J domain-containing protein n=1 Tax=uncultured Sphingomonas sp. TaxID=158754 RepID=UPI002603CBA5|nr:J domain-containing protein [uncultured Sphingomonas sp.]
MADPYQTLGVARTADEAAIKKAYRKLAKELHPDRNTDNPKAADRFSAVTNAYDLLSDKDKRARFDRGEIDGDGNPKAPFGYGGGPQSAGNPFAGRSGGFRPGGGPGGAAGFDQGGDFSSIFDDLFNGGGGGGFGGRRGAPPQQKGSDVAYRLAVSFEDAAALRPQRVSLGNGKTIELKLPAGVETGTQRRLGGQGEPGPAGPGDAIVTIEVQPHRFFTREGDDVRLDLPVRLDEAVLGGKVKVPTVDGVVMVTVPSGSTSGRVLRLGGKGFHRAIGSGRGDQLVTLLVDLPADDAELQSFVEGWASDTTRNPRAGLGV